MGSLINGLAAERDREAAGARSGRAALALRAAAAAAACVTLLTLPFAFFGLWGAASVDRGVAEREAALVAAALERRVAQASFDQMTVTIWDDAVLRSRAGDQAWMEGNLGSWLNEVYGVDRVYVLDGAGRPVHAMRDGETVDPAAWEADTAAAGGLVAALRRALADADAEAIGETVVRDLVLHEGTPAIVSARAIVPESDGVSVARGEEYVHVLFHALDAAMIAGLAEETRVEALRIKPGLPPERRGAAAVAVRGAHGPPLAHLAWAPATPGRDLARKALPMIVASAALMLALVGWLAARLIEAARRLQASQRQATAAALSDGLTGVPNRLAFARALEAACDAARMDDRGVAVLYVDLDGFKEVNDAFGHPVGDALLAAVGRRLAAVAADGDIVARLGGDEFAILRGGLSAPEEAAPLAEAVVATIRTPFTLGERRVEIGASVGVAVCAGWGVAPDEILRRADVALYQVKAAGKRGWRFFDPSFDDALRTKRALEIALRRAVEARDELFVVFQPVFDAAGSRALGAEALVRWRRPEVGVLGPAEFVPLAEERGLIAPIGEFVLDAACAVALRSGLPWIAVNASATQFRDPAFASRVLAQIEAHGLTPDRLQIEITETSLLDRSETVARGILALRFAGVKISLDDFGTGFSSLGYLTRLRVDKIKIDRSFVRGLGGPESAGAVVKAILDLGRALALDVTAEGVETEAERKALEALGAPEMQGFLFSEPLEEHELLALLARLRTAPAPAPAPAIARG